MKKILFFFFALFLLAPSLALANTSFPSFPMSFYGTANLDGANLPAGTKIQAFAGGTLAGETTLSSAGVYGYDDPTKNRLIVGKYLGSELDFEYVLPNTSLSIIGNTANKYSSAFVAGTSSLLNLVFTTPPAPAPSSGGGGGGSSSGGGSGATLPKTTTVITPTKIITVPKTATSTTVTPSATPAVLGVKVIDYSSFSTLFGVSGDLVNSVSENESETIFGQTAMPQLNAVNLNIFNKTLGGYPVGLSETQKNSIAYFIQIGTPTTKRLGSGDRASALNSYLAAFGNVPSSISEWQDVIKIANGRWPSQQNANAVAKATVLFKKVYLRAPNPKNSNDSNAVTIIAYGLRPASRNLNSEKIAIKSFKYIFGYNPTSAVDWNVVMAIAYSGAKR